MRKLLTIVLALSIFLTGCSLGATPEPTPDMQATVDVLMGTSVAATLTAQPTNTLVPTSTDTPQPTETPEPIITDTPVPTETPVPTLTLTSVPFVGCFAPAGTGNINLGVFRFENNTKSTVQVYLHGVSLNGNKTVDCSFTVTTSFNTEIIYGNYDYRVVIGNRAMTGSFNILSSDKTTMRIFDKKVNIAGP